MTEKKIIESEESGDDVSDVNDTPTVVSAPEQNSASPEVGEATMITLISCDDVCFSIPLAAAKASGLIVDTLGCEEEDEDDDDATDKEFEPISLPRVDGECLEKVIEFLEHHAEDPLPRIQQPLGGNSIEEVVTNPWYQNYVNDLDRTMLFRLLAAANFMEIPHLLDLMCLRCTFQIYGKTAEEIRILLNFPSMTPEQEAQARIDHPWVFESLS